MGHGKMAAVALATEWRVRGESERKVFGFFGWIFKVVEVRQRICKEGRKDAKGSEFSKASLWT